MFESLWKFMLIIPENRLHHIKKSLASFGKVMQLIFTGDRG